MTKRCAVEPVGEVGPRCSDERAADDRRHRPTDVLARLDERVGARQLLLVDEVRQAGVDGRAKEAGRKPCDRRQDNDLSGALRERQRAEDAGPNEVGDDHQAAP